MLLLVAFQLGNAPTDAVVVGSEASASTMEIDLEVSAPPGGSVVAHLIEPGGAPQLTVALRERSPGRYGGITEVRRVDFVVVFEALGLVDAQSEPARLTALGLDRAILGALPVSPTTSEAGGVSNERAQWGWLGLALGSLSLAALALWALPERTKREVADPDAGASDDQPAERTPTEPTEPLPAAPSPADTEDHRPDEE